MVETDNLQQATVSKSLSWEGTGLAEHCLGIGVFAGALTMSMLVGSWPFPAAVVAPVAVAPVIPLEGPRVPAVPQKRWCVHPSRWQQFDL